MGAYLHHLHRKFFRLHPLKPFSKTVFIITDSEGRKIESKSARGTFINWLKELYLSKEHAMMMEKQAMDKHGPTIFTKNPPLEKDKKLFTQISSGLWVYSNLSRAVLAKRIEMIAKALGLEASIRAL